MNWFFVFLKEIKLAFMNLFRNKRRTIITLLSVVMGTVFLMSFEGYVNKMEVGFRDQLIENGIGHFRIYKKGFEKLNQPFSMEKSFTPKDKTIIDDVSESMNEVEFTAPRIDLNGIVGNYEKSSIFIGYGGKPSLENRLKLKTVSGEKGLSEEEYDRAVIGTGLAKKLDAKSDDMLIVTTQNEYGGMEAINIRVGGEIDLNSKQLNNIRLIVSLRTAQELLYTENVQYIIVMLEDAKYIDKVITELMQKTQEKGLDIEIKLWSELTDVYHMAVRLFRMMVDVALIIIVFLVVFGISNTIFMAVMERVSEFGTLRAVGISKIEILRVILYESIFIGILGIIFSIIIVNIVQPVFNSMGITLPPSPGVPYPTPIEIMVTIETYVKFSFINLSAMIVASIIPALKGANTNIVDAIRHS